MERSGVQVGGAHRKTGGLGSMLNASRARSDKNLPRSEPRSLGAYTRAGPGDLLRPSGPSVAARADVDERESVWPTEPE